MHLQTRCSMRCVNTQRWQKGKSEEGVLHQAILYFRVTHRLVQKNLPQELSWLIRRFKRCCASALCASSASTLMCFVSSGR